jgi:hypothetical protein
LEPNASSLRSGAGVKDLRRKSVFFVALLFMFIALVLRHVELLMSTYLIIYTIDPKKGRHKGREKSHTWTSCAHN